MGHLKRASSKKGKETTSRPSLASQILGKKVKKVKKHKISDAKEQEAKDVQSERKLAKKIVTLSKISDIQDLDQEHQQESEQMAMHRMISHLKNVHVDNKNNDILESDETYYDRFIENEFPGDLRSEIELNDKKISLTYIKSQPIICLQNADISPEIYELYEKIGFLLSNYRSGTIPKALKAVSNTYFYKELLQIMQPSNWTAAAMFQVTRHFVACAKPNVCNEYFKDIILPRIRDDIAEYGRLNYHIFNALCKATHKPAAFFKGIIFSICENECTVKEAVVLSSVINQSHFPSAHVAAALIKITQFPYSVANCVFMRFILQKRCLFPVIALDRLLEYFKGFEDSSIDPSMSWHHVLLLFVQNYRNYFDVEKKAQILSLIKIKKHHAISLAIAVALKNENPPSQVV